MVTAGRESGTAAVSPGATSFFAHPCFRFSAAQLPHDDRYAPARCDAACTEACACVRSGFCTAEGQSSGPDIKEPADLRL